MIRHLDSQRLLLAVLFDRIHSVVVHQSLLHVVAEVVPHAGRERRLRPARPVLLPCTGEACLVAALLHARGSTSRGLGRMGVVEVRRRSVVLPLPDHLTCAHCIPFCALPTGPPIGTDIDSVTTWPRLSDVVLCDDTVLPRLTVRQVVGVKHVVICHDACHT